MCKPDWLYRTQKSHRLRMLQLVDRVEILKGKWDELHDQLQQMSNACDETHEQATQQRIVTDAEKEILDLLELCVDVFRDVGD